MLDSVKDEVWRADDVLGWVYEYYNRPVVEALDAKNTLEPEDVGPANQFLHAPLGRSDARGQLPREALS